MLAVQLKNITKLFGQTIACHGVSLSVEKGRIHALIGENGAGKSTLMRILYGLIQPDAGEIRINDQLLNMKNSRIAIFHGLGMVHQHLKLIPRFTVLENIILGEEPQVWGRLELTKARDRIEDLLARLGFGLKLDDLVENLSLGEQQRLEIIKALYRQVEILILDEPTAVLSPMEIEELFQLLRNLRQQGHTLIFISHKLEEVLSLADTITVMRRGKHIKTFAAKDTDINQLACLMMGREITLPVNKHLMARGKAVLEIKSLSSRAQQGHPTIEQLSLNIHEGEILGLAGVAGNGQTELVELLTGLRASGEGQIFLKGNEVTNFSPFQLRKAGIAHIPEDRHQRGIVDSFSVRENLLLGQQHNKRWQRWGCWDSNAVRNQGRQLIEKFNVQPPDLNAQIQYFSGGNQQKVVLAREISQEYSLLIACQPTRGLDLAASAFVYQQLLGERSNGKAILLVSTELEEIMALSDRIGVIYRGQLIALLELDAVSSEQLGALMGGAAGSCKQP